MESRKPVKKADPAALKTTSGAASAITEENVDQVEKDTVEKVNIALSALESAIASWEATKDRPLDLEPRFIKYRRLHDALVDWQTKVLRSAGRDMDFYARVDRLWEFVGICKHFQ